MHGALTLRTYPRDQLVIRCDHCDRTGRYSRAKMIDRFGPETTLPDILSAVTAGRATAHHAFRLFGRHGAMAGCPTVFAHCRIKSSGQRAMYESVPRPQKQDDHPYY